MIRERKDSDDAELLALYSGEKVPEFCNERVLVEDGKIVGHAGIRMVPEACIKMASGHPAAKMRWLRFLQGEFVRYVNDTGCKRLICFIPPKIARPYMRRLASMGWLEGYQSAIWLEGDE